MDHSKQGEVARPVDPQTFLRPNDDGHAPDRVRVQKTDVKETATEIADSREDSSMSGDLAVENGVSQTGPDVSDQPNGEGFSGANPETDSSVQLEERDPVFERLEQLRKEFGHTARPGVPVPTQGLAKLRYQWWANGHGRDFVVPPLGKKEAEAYFYKSAHVELLIEELQTLADTSRRILAVLNSKGGAGKTPLACYFESVLMWAIDLQCMVVDANENDGTTCAWMGVDSDSTHTIRYAMDHMAEFSTYGLCCVNLGSPRGRNKGSLVMGSDAEVKKPFTKQKFVRLIQTLWECCHSVVLDTGNGNEWPANEGSAAVATDLVLSAMSGDTNSYDKLVSTMAAYYGLGYDAKVKRSFIVVNATREGDTKEHVLKLLTKSLAALNKKRLANREEKLSFADLGINKESIFFIPFDGYITGGNVVDVPSLGIDTLIAYLEVLVAIFKQESPVPDLEAFLVQESEDPAS